MYLKMSHACVLFDRSTVMQKNYKDAVLETKKVLLTNKAISKTLAQMSKKVKNFQAKDENIQQLKRAANAERQKIRTLEKELERQLKR